MQLTFAGSSGTSRNTVVARVAKDIAGDLYSDQHSRIAFVECATSRASRNPLATISSEIINIDFDTDFYSGTSQSQYSTPRTSRDTVVAFSSKDINLNSAAGNPLPPELTL